jgi:hypothetical protein
MLAEPKLAQAEEEQLPVIINELRAKRVRVNARGHWGPSVPERMEGRRFGLFDGATSPDWQGRL